MRILTILFTTLTLAITVSCSIQPRALDGSIITIEGSSTVYPISFAMAQQYNAFSGRELVNVSLSSTGIGFERLSSGAIDIANASRPINQMEIQACQANGIQFIELPVAYDAIAVVVNQNNNWAHSISKRELATLWNSSAEGKILRWNQIRANWPDKPINLFAPDRKSGTFDYFSKAIVGKSDLCRQDYTAHEEDDAIAEAIVHDIYALGYFGLSYYITNSDKLRALAIDDEDESNGTGPQMPSSTNVINKVYQPLSRPLFIYVSKTAANRKEIWDFVAYYLGNTRQVAESCGAISLSEEIIQSMIRRFEQRIYGTCFEGKGAVIDFTMDDLLDLSLEELMDIELK